MEKNRTEDVKILQSFIRVSLGGTEYEIQPLTINQQYLWREKFFKEFQGVAKVFKKESRLLIFLKRKDETEQFVDAMQVSFLSFPRRVSDLFFAYAPNLPRKFIEKTANEGELMQAFLKIWRLAFPFFDLLEGVLNLVAPVLGKSMKLP